MKVKLQEINEKTYSSKQDFKDTFKVGKNKYCLIQKQEDEIAGHTLIMYKDPEIDDYIPVLYLNWQATNLRVSIDSFHGIEAIMYLRQKDLKWFQEHEENVYIYYSIGDFSFEDIEMIDKIFKWTYEEDLKDISISMEV